MGERRIDFEVLTPDNIRELANQTYWEMDSIGVDPATLEVHTPAKAAETTVKILAAHGHNPFDILKTLATTTIVNVGVLDGKDLRFHQTFEDWAADHAGYILSLEMRRNPEIIAENTRRRAVIDGIKAEAQRNLART